MKKLFIQLIVIVLSMSLWGCSNNSSQIQPVGSPNIATKDNSSETQTSSNSENMKKTENIDVQVINSVITESHKYPEITVEKGRLVKWIINVDEENINGCNNVIIIPKYKIEKQIQPGENIIEFTPENTGTIPYSCWMGMIRSKITVVDKPVS